MRGPNLPWVPGKSPQWQLLRMHMGGRVPCLAPLSLEGLVAPWDVGVSVSRGFFAGSDPGLLVPAWWSAV